MLIAETDSKNPAKQGGAGASLRVFVVENHVDTREFLTFMLEELGHTVFAAETMAKALRDVPAANCDVLISDIGLPDGDGWELLSRLDLPRPIYAIAMSGFGMSSDRVRSKAVGFRHHLVKPMGLEQLESILNSAAEELQRSGQPNVIDRKRFAASAKAS
jgi:CheY-like chemotaxis protein